LENKPDQMAERVRWMTLSILEEFKSRNIDSPSKIDYVGDKELMKIVTKIMDESHLKFLSYLLG